MANTTEKIRQQITDLIDQVVLPMELARLEVDPKDVADRVDKLLDPGGAAPTKKTYCSTMHLRDLTRERLRGRHDPVKKAKDYVQHGEDHQTSLFDDQLQDYYPVTRQDSPEQPPEHRYCPREHLNRLDVQRICRRMDRASEALARHSRALMAWFLEQREAK